MAKQTTSFPNLTFYKFVHIIISSCFKNEDIVNIFQTNGMQIFPKATHKRRHEGKSEDLRILAAYAVKRCTADQIETGSHCTQF